MLSVFMNILSAMFLIQKPLCLYIPRYRYIIIIFIYICQQPFFSSSPVNYFSLNEDSRCFLELVVHANVLFDDKKICPWTERALKETNHYF